MNLVESLIVLLPVMAPAVGHATSHEMTVGDSSLRSLPPRVEALVRRTPGVDRGACKIVGKPVGNLDSSGHDVYAVTTSGCGNPASDSPIWMVSSGSAPSILLFSSGRQISSINSQNYGWKALRVATGASKGGAAELWRFDGTRYKRVIDVARNDR